MNGVLIGIHNLCFAVAVEVEHGRTSHIAGHITVGCLPDNGPVHLVDGIVQATSNTYLRGAIAIKVSHRGRPPPVAGAVNQWPGLEFDPAVVEDVYRPIEYIDNFWQPI